MKRKFIESDDESQKYMRKLKISSNENLDSLSENSEKQFKNQQKNILSSSDEENPINIKIENENSNQIKRTLVLDL